LLFWCRSRSPCEPPRSQISIFLNMEIGVKVVSGGLSEYPEYSSEGRCWRHVVWTIELGIISHQTVANWPNLFSHELRHVLMWCWCCVVVDKDGETVRQTALLVIGRGVWIGKN
jgi:hypothetical protein